MAARYAPPQVTAGQITPAVIAAAAAEALRRRRAVDSFVEYNRYIAEEEAGEEGEPEYPADHHVLLCQALQSLADDSLLWGEPVRNLMVFMPPGMAKSTYATVRFPAWYLGRFKRRGVISASYNDTLAEHFGKKVRNLVASPAHLALFPHCMLSEDSRAKGEWETDGGGFYFAAGVGVGVTGRRGDLVIGDDLIKGRFDAESPTVRDKTWEWWKDDVRTRLKPKTARRVLIGTRWHEDDPCGRILPDGWGGQSGVFTGKDGGRWHVLCFPAQAIEGDALGREPGEWLWPEYFSPEAWQAERAARDARSWASLYQQQPRPETGDILDEKWVRWYSPADIQGMNFRFYGASDYAVTARDQKNRKKPDWSEHGVIGVNHVGDWYIRDWWGDQVTTDVSTDMEITMAKRWGVYQWFGESGVIENSIAPIRAQRQRERQRDEGASVYYSRDLVSSAGDKVSKVQAFKGLLHSGKVYLPLGEPWAMRLVDLMTRFRGLDGDQDDAIDVLGILGRALAQMRDALPPAMPTSAEMPKITLNNMDRRRDEQDRHKRRLLR